MGDGVIIIVFYFIFIKRKVNVGYFKREREEKFFLIDFSILKWLYGMFGVDVCIGYNL